MNHWEVLDSAPTYDGVRNLILMRRGHELAIYLDGEQLMNSREHGSEEALADLACDRLANPNARILIGGLGLGFTLAAALRRLGPQGRVVVAELMPKVVEWNRGILGEVAGEPLADSRASIHAGDVRELMRDPPQPWDAILLDVDNGPEALSHPSNEWLYGWSGLGAASAALTPGGVLGVWASSPDPAFTKRFKQAGFQVRAHTVRSHGKKGYRHTVWMGVRPR